MILIIFYRRNKICQNIFVWVIIFKMLQRGMKKKIEPKFICDSG